MTNYVVSKLMASFIFCIVNPFNLLDSGLLFATMKGQSNRNRSINGIIQRSHLQLQVGIFIDKKCYDL